MKSGKGGLNESFIVIPPASGASRAVRQDAKQRTMMASSPPVIVERPSAEEFDMATSFFLSAGTGSEMETSESRSAKPTSSLYPVMEMNTHNITESTLFTSTSDRAECSRRQRSYVFVEDTDYSTATNTCNTETCEGNSDGVVNGAKRTMGVNHYIRSALTNAKFTVNSKWHSLSDFDKRSPVVLLGLQLSPPRHLERLQAIYADTVWFSYRSGFEALDSDKTKRPAPKKGRKHDAAKKSYSAEPMNPDATCSSGLTSDSGWGCMVRSAQMMLCVAVERALRLQSGMAYQRSSCSLSEMIDLFYDSLENPFSIHNIVSVLSDKVSGEWFGPHSVSVALQVLFNRLRDNGIDGRGNGVMEFVRRCLGFYRVDSDGIVDLHKLSACLSQYEFVYVMIPLYLSQDRLLPHHILLIKYFLSCHGTLGIVGGKPKSSYYIMGYQDSDEGTSLIYLDPHKVQPAERPAIDLQSYFCRSPPLRMSAGALDPCFAVGFLVVADDGSRLNASNDAITVTALRNFLSRLKEARLTSLAVTSSGPMTTTAEFSRPNNDADDSLGVIEFD